MKILTVSIPAYNMENYLSGTVLISFNSFASVTDIIDDGHNGILVKPFL